MALPSGRPASLSPPAGRDLASYQVPVSPGPAPGSGASAGAGRLAALRAWFAQRRRRRGAKSAAVVMSVPAAAAAAAAAAGADGRRRSAPSGASLDSPAPPAPPPAAGRLPPADASALECPLCLSEMVTAPRPPSPSSSSPSPSPSPSPCASSSSSSAASSASASSLATAPRLLLACRHAVCLGCWQQYLRVQISESQVPVTCPACPAQLHPDDVRRLLDTLRSPEEAASLKEKYELYALRRVLAACPEARWCPAPDCHFALIAEKCDSCPRLKCLRPGCGTVFCYRCKQAWHQGKSCKTARAAKIAEVLSAIDPVEGEVKKCPECGMYVLKMNDGTCNHMVCNICGCEFCWLCMSKVGDMHFLSPSGCTFWGRKPWSRRKRLFLQVATLVGAPVGIALLAGLAVPALTFGIPVWAGRRAVRNFEEPDIHKLRLNAVLAVFFSFMLSPFIAAVVVGVGVPVLFAYVYTVVPVALCRSLESACSCADLRDRLLDCLDGSSGDELHSLQTSLDEQDFRDAAAGDESGHDGGLSSIASLRARLRSWLQRLRGDGAVVGQPGYQGEQKERRKRRRSRQEQRRRRRRRDGDGGDERHAGSGSDRRVGDENRCPQSLTPDDLLRLEAILLDPATEAAAASASAVPSGDGTTCGSQQLRVEVHAEMPPMTSQVQQQRSPGPVSDLDDLGPVTDLDNLEPVESMLCVSHSSSATPMTAVEVDPPCGDPGDAALAFPDHASMGHESAPPILPGAGKQQRSKSLEVDHELAMLRHMGDAGESSA